MHFKTGTHLWTVVTFRQQQRPENRDGLLSLVTPIFTKRTKQHFTAVSMAEGVYCDLRELLFHSLFPNWSSKAVALLLVPIIYVSIQHIKAFRANKPYTNWLPACNTRRNAMRWLFVYMILLLAEVFEGVWMVNFQLAMIFSDLLLNPKKDKWGLWSRRWIPIILLLLVLSLFHLIWWDIVVFTCISIKELCLWPPKRESHPPRKRSYQKRQN